LALLSEPSPPLQSWFVSFDVGEPDHDDPFTPAAFDLDALGHDLGEQTAALAAVLIGTSYPMASGDHYAPHRTVGTVFGVDASMRMLLRFVLNYYSNKEASSRR
jgi:hypothetical protein